MKKVNKIEPLPPSAPVRKRVAAYARISEEKGRTMHSLAAQVSFYSDFIQKHCEWEYAGVYADSGLSGTTGDREEFKRLLADCEAGRIDIILTKSISRFARNTVDLLETVRHLRGLGIEVRFEKERINSLSEDGELMITLLASFAQEESRSISENVKWAIRKNFQKGIGNSFCIYGYRWNGEEFEIVPEEAEIVRLIFDNFLNGISAERTEKQLEEMGVKSYNGQHFSNSSIRAILRQERYTGNTLFQKTYIENHITHRTVINRGELPQYYAENTHPAIISVETFNRVQEEIQRRRSLGAAANPHIPTTCFTSRLKCAQCGRSFRRHTYNRASGTVIVWGCRGKDDKGVAFCNSANLPEAALREACCSVLELDAFDEGIFLERVDTISVCANRLLVFHLSSGEDVHHVWEWNSTARKDCWTEERRREWRERHKGINNNSSKNPFTGMLHCPLCGGNFRRQVHKYADGTDSTFYRCGTGKSCENGCTIQERMLKEMICGVLGLDDFDESVFKKRISGIELSGDAERRAVFSLTDGSTITKEWKKPPKRGVKHTEEWKQKMSKLWSERKRGFKCREQ